ncbi:MAG: putative hydrolase [uncultured marine phage]|uniref:Putative hydrolase n=1 Tax=uncultured marine phage TaxID=707152 RepID=A0A8D9CCE9_9VIRU|nr:MAG: putative hydrolase [uncultured marine phage]
MKDIKHAVQVVLFNDKGEVLCVSRKNDHTDFGLPGGKVDDTDKTFKDAAIREVKEETGLDIKKKTMMEIFSMHKDGYMGHTYLAKWSGDIETDEPHEIKWGSFKDLKAGSFGYWNSIVEKSLINMGVIDEIDTSNIYRKVSFKLASSNPTEVKLIGRAKGEMFYHKQSIIDLNSKDAILVEIEDDVEILSDSFLKGFFEKPFKKLKTAEAVRQKFVIKTNKYQKEVDNMFKILEAIINS